MFHFIRFVILTSVNEQAFSGPHSRAVFAREWAELASRTEGPCVCMLRGLPCGIQTAPLPIPDVPMRGENALKRNSKDQTLPGCFDLRSFRLRRTRAALSMTGLEDFKQLPHYPQV